MINQIKYAKLNPNAKPPFRKNPTDAGIDFYSCEDITVFPHTMKIVHTGITVEIPEHFALLIKPKSKNNHLIGAGIIDPFYEPGEILTKIVNISDEPIRIKTGDPIAQGIYIPIETPELVEVQAEELKNNNPRSGKGGITSQAREQQIYKELGF